MLSLLTTSIEIGLLYSFAILGVYLTFRVLDFPDLTVDGSFVTGAAGAALAIQSGVPGVAALVIGFLFGCIAGAATSLLHIKLGISKILSGVLVLGILYTINLRIMSGPNISLLNEEGVFSILQATSNSYVTILFLLALILASKFFVDWFLQTETGLAIRATGDNEVTARSFGINTNRTKLIAICLSNGFIGLSGALVAQHQGFVDVNMAVGLIIVGIAGLMLGEALIPNLKIPLATLGVICGAVLYEFVVNLSLRAGLPATDLKLVTAVIVIFSLVLVGKKIGYGKTISTT